MNQEELNKILDNHLKWLENNGEGERADLSRADLRYANLRYANLWEAILYGADLSRANLLGAILYGADLSRANLSETDLREADLREANLREANLREANLRGANLREADLREARNISKSLAASLLVCPEEGSFIGWKKCGQDEESVIIKLLITENAKRSSATTRKCRCSEAKVLDIQSIEGKSILKEYNHKAYGHITRYAVDEMVYPDSFDENRWNECSNGIHFFITRQEAVDY